ncbi:MAG: hypothetical protein H6622_16785 [Halobacteriovoraceae bacterium]|nr:hypothetical protein [Halobacteriovoraceae bacterium]
MNNHLSEDLSDESNLNLEDMNDDEILTEEENFEVSTRSIQKKFVAHFKKDREEDALIVSHMMDELNNSAIGEIPFEDVVVYLFENKLEESDYPEIRSLAFDRKVEEARKKYNKENKADLSTQDFLATTLNAYLQ